MRMTLNLLRIVIAVFLTYAWAFIAVPALNLHIVWVIAISVVMGQGLCAWIHFYWSDA